MYNKTLKMADFGTDHTVNFFAVNPTAFRYVPFQDVIQM